MHGGTTQEVGRLMSFVIRLLFLHSLDTEEPSAMHSERRLVDMREREGGERERPCGQVRHVASASKHGHQISRARKHHLQIHELTSALCASNRSENLDGWHLMCDTPTGRPRFLKRIMPSVISISLHASEVSFLLFLPPSCRLPRSYAPWSPLMQLRWGQYNDNEAQSSTHLTPRGQNTVSPRRDPN